MTDNEFEKLASQFRQYDPQIRELANSGMPIQDIRERVANEYLIDLEEKGELLKPGLAGIRSEFEDAVNRNAPAWPILEKLYASQNQPKSLREQEASKFFVKPMDSTITQARMSGETKKARLENPDPSFLGDIGSAISGGVSLLKKMSSDMAMAGAATLGENSLSDYFGKVSDQAAIEMAKEPLKYENMTEAWESDSLGSMLRYGVTQGLFKNAPQMAGVALAYKVNPRLGLAMSMGLAAGDVASTQKENTGEIDTIGAAPYTVVYGLLDSILPSKLAKSLSGSAKNVLTLGTVKELASNKQFAELLSKAGAVAMQVTKEGGKGAAEEAVTESLQSLVSKAAVKVVNENYEVFNKENFGEAGVEGFLGAFGGGGMRSAKSLYGSLQGTQKPTAPQGPSPYQVGQDTNIGKITAIDGATYTILSPEGEQLKIEGHENLASLITGTERRADVLTAAEGSDAARPLASSPTVATQATAPISEAPDVDDDSMANLKGTATTEDQTLEELVSNLEKNNFGQGPKPATEQAQTPQPEAQPEAAQPTAKVEPVAEQPAPATKDAKPEVVSLTESDLATKEQLKSLKEKKAKIESSPKLKNSEIGKRALGVIQLKIEDLAGKLIDTSRPEYEETAIDAQQAEEQAKELANLEKQKKKIEDRLQVKDSEVGQKLLANVQAKINDLLVLTESDLAPAKQLTQEVAKTSEGNQTLAPVAPKAETTKQLSPETKPATKKDEPLKPKSSVSVEDALFGSGGYDERNLDPAEFLLSQDGNKAGPFVPPSNLPKEKGSMNLSEMLDADAESKPAPVKQEQKQEPVKKTLPIAEGAIADNFERYNGKELDVVIKNLFATRQKQDPTATLPAFGNNNAPKKAWIRNELQMQGKTLIDVNGMQDLGQIRAAAKLEGIILPETKDIESLGENASMAEKANALHQIHLQERAKIAKFFKENEQDAVMNGKLTFKNIKGDHQIKTDREAIANPPQKEKVETVKRPRSYWYLNSNGGITKLNEPVADLGIYKPVSRDALKHHKQNIDPNDNAQVEAANKYINSLSNKTNINLYRNSDRQEIESEMYNSKYKKDFIEENGPDEDVDPDMWSKGIKSESDQPAPIEVNLSTTAKIQALADAMKLLNKSRMKFNFYRGGKNGEEGSVSRSTGVININLDQATANDMLRLLIHEDFTHTALKGILGEQEFEKLLDQVSALSMEGEALAYYGKEVRAKYSRADGKISKDVYKNEVLANWYQYEAGLPEQSGIFRDLIIKVTRFFRKEFKNERTELETVKNTIDKAFLKYIESDKAGFELSNKSQESVIGNKGKGLSDDILFSLSISYQQKAESIIKKQRPDLDPKVIMDELEKYPNDETAKAALHWRLKDRVILSEDKEKIVYAVKLAKSASVNPIDYEGPAEIISAFSDKNSNVKPRIDPNKEPRLYKLSTEIVEDSVVEEYQITDDNLIGQRLARNIMDGEWGTDANPWCLTYQEDGKLTKASKERWIDYSETDKRLVYLNGKLNSFYANGEYWDRNDINRDGVMIKKPVKDFADDPKAYEMISHSTGASDGFIYSGNTNNGEHRIYAASGKLVESTHYKNGKMHGEKKVFSNGVLAELSVYDNGTRRELKNFNFNGSLRFSGKYDENGIQDGELLRFRPDGSKQSMEFYNKNGIAYGIRWNEKGIVTSEFGIKPSIESKTDDVFYSKQIDRAHGITKSKFYSSYLQSKNIRNVDPKIVMDKGWIGGAGAINVTPVYRGGEPRNVVEKAYGPKKGDVIFLVPKDQVKGDKVMDGWKPKLHEVVTVESNNQDMWELFSKTDKDVLYSKQIDRDYMALTKDPEGNKKELQKMVDEAAKKAGFNDKVYHGTPTGGFTIFKNRPTYFSKDKDIADIYKAPSASSIRTWAIPDEAVPETKSLFIKAENTFDTRNKAHLKKWNDEFYRKRGTGSPLSDRGVPDWTDGTDLHEWIEETSQPFDSFVLDEGGLPQGDGKILDRGISIVVWGPSQIKSSDPITYDAKGNIIPLSERFNEESDSILYSKKITKPVDVNSKEFKRWFGDSKVRDSYGLPKKVYSGQPKGRLVFDKAIRSEIGGVGFFTESEEVAKLYAGTADSEISGETRYSLDKEGEVGEYFLKIENPWDPDSTSNKELNKWLFSAAREQSENFDSLTNKEKKSAGWDYFINKYGLPDDIENYDNDFDVWQESKDLEDYIRTNIMPIVGLRGYYTEGISKTAHGALILEEKILFDGIVSRFGYDGIIYKDSEHENETIYVPLRPTQIKSAISNTGEYSDEDPNIMYSKNIPVPFKKPKSPMAGIDWRALRNTDKNAYDELIKKSNAYNEAMDKFGEDLTKFLDGRQFATKPNEEGKFAIITKSVRKGEDPWQVTRFDELGAAGHESYKTYEAAIKGFMGEDRLSKWNLESIEVQDDKKGDVLYSKAIDKEYFKAIEANEMNKAQSIIEKAASDAGHLPGSDFRISHQAPSSDGGENLATIMNNSILPKDYWTMPHYYQNTPEESASFHKIKSALDKMERMKQDGKDPMLATIRVFRAVPKDIKEDKIRNGDWVSPLREYAEMEGKNINGGYRVIENSVKVKDLWWDANSMAEWGYDDGNGYVYKNTKNNRKLIETIVKDYDGKIVPPSKRFSTKKYEVFYSKYISPELSSKIGPRNTLDQQLRDRGMSLTDRIVTQAKIIISKFTQGALDKGAPLKGLDSSGLLYELNRSALGIATAVNSFLKHGEISWKGNSPTVKTRLKGITELFREMGADNAEKYLLYRMGERAQAFVKAGKNPSFSPAAIKELLSFGKDIKNLDSVNKRFNSLNESVLNFAVESGLLNPDIKAKFREEFYIPFYRVMDDQADQGFYNIASKYGGKNIDNYIEKYVGGDQKIGDPMENMIKNWTTLINQSIQNKMRDPAVRRMHEMGLAVKMIQKPVKGRTDLGFADIDMTTHYDEKIKYKEEPILDDAALQKEGLEYFNFTTPYDKKKERILSHMENGERVHYRILSDEMLVALTVAKPELLDNWVMKSLMLPKRMLTYTATFGFGFKVANVIRDATTIALTHKNFNPFMDTFKGMYKSFVQDEDYVRQMSAMGGFENGYTGSDASETAKNIRKSIKPFTLLSTPARALKFWEDIGSAMENGARLGLFLKREKEFGTTKAAFDSRDTLDFHLTGAADSVRVLTALTPFLNARLQGMYKLARSAKQNPKHMAVGLGIIAAATMVLWAARDEEKWKALEDYDKYVYWHFWIGGKHFRIPKPFELSVVPNSIEVMLDIMNGDEDMKKIMPFMISTLRDNLNLLDMPAAIKPVVEQWANKEFFTGRDIVPGYMEKLSPEAQAQPWTGTTVKLLANGVPDMGALISGKGLEFGVSPLRVQHLAKAFGSTVAETILSASDWVINGVDQAVGNPLGTKPRPAMSAQDVPLFGRFIRNDVPRNTKYGTEYYKMRDEISNAYLTVQHYKKLGDVEAARDLIESNKWQLRMKTFADVTDKRLGLLRKKANAIWGSENMAPDEKKRQLDDISKRQTEIQKIFYDKYRELRKQNE